MKKPELSGKLSALLEAFLIIAKERIEEKGTFDPFGAVMTSDMKITFIETLDDSDLFLKGNPGAQMMRRIEDQIRAMRRKTNLSCAVIFYDANIRPLEGGDSVSAMVGRFEEKDVQAAQVIIEYELRGGRLKLGKQTIIEKTHHLLPTESPSS
jgi:hypothetical protein